MVRKILTVAILIAIATPVFAVTRQEELETRYKQLIQQRALISEELLRIEGAYAERKQIEKENQDKPAPAPEPEKKDN